MVSDMDYASELAWHARIYATAAHAAIGQRRKYTNEPYIEHPRRVVAILMDYPHTPEMIAAAWLHDVVEDTHVSNADILDEFGPTVAGIVSDLTNVPVDCGNRLTRFFVNKDRLEKARPAAQQIKLADILDNVGSIVEHDPRFAPTYLREKEQVLEVLREGSPLLWQLCQDKVNDGKKALAA